MKTIRKTRAENLCDAPRVENGFNHRHPELKRGEFFVANFTKDEFESLRGKPRKFKGKTLASFRMGRHAYDWYGKKVMRKINGCKLYPVFAKMALDSQKNFGKFRAIQNSP